MPIPLFMPLLKLFHLILGLETAHKFPPPLGGAEEAEAFRAAREGNTEARQRLILHNLRLVSHIVRKYYATARNQEDLVSIGTIGLVKAVDNFNTDLDVKFSTYAVPMIIGEIRRYLRDNNAIRISRSVRDLAYRALSAREELMREKSVTEVSSLLGYSSIHSFSKAYKNFHSHSPKTSCARPCASMRRGRNDPIWRG